MSKYRFIKERDEDNKYDRTELEMTCEAILLEDILEDFRDFLLASGFSISGNLEVVEE